ncbi:MAG: flagellar hook-associated protein 3 [Treponema sp.]|jgi:flagellar hook-associated protein 3 FlgL|nr:flagellar hook-associated protein 3 [Treponema sp.]
MKRISSDMPATDVQYRLRRQEEGRANIESKIASNTRIKELRDDPLAAAHSTRYDSYITRLKRYEQNTKFAMEHFDFQDSYFKEFNDILQRIRVLAVTGANGVYTKDESRYMAIEVNELLKELVDIANRSGPDAKQLFAGDKAFTEPFRLIEGTVEGGGETLVIGVEYRGAGASRRTEISDGSYITMDIGGGEAFWAEKMNVISRFDANNYRVTQDSAFFVDGAEIQLTAGDTLHTIVAKINDSPAPVKAYVDPETRGLALIGTDAHLIRMEDRQDSRVLQDLGVIRSSNDPYAPNWHETALVSGGSAFDMVIRLRDSLYRHDSEFTGSQGLGGVDLALSNLAARRTLEGSRRERAEMTWMRLNEEINNVTVSFAREHDLDFASAATELAMMDFAHRAALQMAAKVIPATLLDFIR